MTCFIWPGVHAIAHNRYLQLQGIHAGGRLVHIELDQIYITLRTTQQRTVYDEERWLTQEASLAPGERQRSGERETITEAVTVSVNEALAKHRRLVVLGDPGCGKTTLLRYLTLVFARDKAASNGVVRKQLGLTETGTLPILLPLRQLAAFLEAHSEESTEGHRLMLDFLHSYLRNERLDVPLNFFDAYLQSGRAVILFDGLDEVADPGLRRRVARLIESFTRAYSRCRYVVTSRIVGYTGTARLGEDYATSTVRDFTLEDVEQFLSHWNRLVAIGHMGPGAPAESYAAEQTRQLMDAIRSNERIRELVINPLLLTVVALVHRDRIKLPDRRAELYAEAVDVLLGKWDEAKGLSVGNKVIAGRPFDTADRRLLLQSVALHMHEARLKEIEGEALRDLLVTMLGGAMRNEDEAPHAVEQFLQVIEERTGLLTARGQGVFAFSHLTFQEYLAALAIAGRDDYIAYTLNRVADSWWREVILLETGYLSTQSNERTTRLIKAIAEYRIEPELYHNLVLAAECLRDVGERRVQGALHVKLVGQLRTAIQTGLTTGQRVVRFFTGSNISAIAERRVAAATALATIGGQRFWSLPYGEPDWVEIPGGKFVMGSTIDDPVAHEDELPQHELHLELFWIAPVPITNAQYELFAQATGYGVPEHWQDGRVPRGREGHPVIGVAWQDVASYCRWLGRMTNRSVKLPSEAEWEKAARGTDGRIYPWGDRYELGRCNDRELQLGITTPVGIFPEGSSPYGVLDMSGNVWEWTRSRYCTYPYKPGDGREERGREVQQGSFVLRGGSFIEGRARLRCATRNSDSPHFRFDLINYGFRVAVSPFHPHLATDEWP